jgi:EAL domain-containing protein (putative c-di-GMP-specific phosphodiesterase class I)
MSSMPAAPLLLIADRDESLRRTLAEKLLACGFRVAEATDVGSLLGALEMQAPQLILLADELPPAADFTIDELLRGRTSPPVVLLTGSDKSWSESQQEGFADLCSKRASLAELQWRISRALRLRRREASSVRRCSRPSLVAEVRRVLEGRGGCKVACLFLALSMGRNGDVDESEVGEAVADRLAHALGELHQGLSLPWSLESMRIARTEGTHFAVLIPNGEPAEVERFARILQDFSTRSLFVGGRFLVESSTSVGMAFAPGDGRTAEELLEASEIAAFCARRSSGGGPQSFKPGMRDWVRDRHLLEKSLPHALERGELEVYYQDKVDVRTERLVGMEALVRWNHAELGLVSPARFIPLAEETGLIVPIGEWVLQEACRQTVEWRNQGASEIRMAVNLSSGQFAKRDLTDSIRAVLRETGLDPRQLELELTESMLMDDAEGTTRTLRELKELGVHLSIDDFGTGYSSLAYLRRFPIDALKIDQSFIREVITNHDDSAIVTSIILMGHSLNLSVVAEGVETRAQLDYLRVLECDQAQGYLFSKPVPAAQALALVLQRSAA